MKKLFIIAALAVSAISCDKNVYSINGQIDGMEGMIYLTDNHGETIDSTMVNEGKFTMKGEAPDVAIKGWLKNDDNSFATIFVEKGKINVTGSTEKIKDVVCAGTPVNDSFNSFMTEVNALDEAETEASDEEYIAVYKKYFDSNNNNQFGTMLLESLAYAITPDETLAMIASIPTELQSDETVQDIKAHAEKMKLTDVGQPYIDFSQPDPEGNDVKLSDVVAANKYVLLDFWASWCGPCMGEVPYLVKDYDDYHDKGFEIFGVSLDRNKEDWTKAINDKEMKWIHVSTVQFWDNDAAKSYAVQSIPSNFLISSDGTIVARNLRGDALAEKLAELLNE